MLAAMPRLLDALAFSAGHPDPRLPHPAAQRLPRNFEIMTLCQLLCRECRSKVCVAFPHQSDRVIVNHIRQAVVRGTTAALVQPCQNIKTVQLALAHHHHAHRNDSLQTPKKEQKLTSLLCSVLTF